MVIRPSGETEVQDSPTPMIVCYAIMVCVYQLITVLQSCNNNRSSGSRICSTLEGKTDCVHLIRLNSPTKLSWVGLFPVNNCSNTTPKL
ncbi:hypothetical protein F3Y22_tig00110458pilonHSYRG00048 [Hibiscus syriacus]|uniref:Uncharacterized protein n=1 Tax=Hibiscus syriacus TaxID=106335 RepID=A0A6A3AHU3_HIBSY|nr:hypothetical protein F3Y22_tig00110458pilonHSYRG00048 [Hibiscus syriacus]